MTVTCARCHDHKYDPIAMKDYYSLYGIFASCAEPTVAPLFEPAPQTDAYAKFDKELKRLEQNLLAFVKAKHEELTDRARKRVAEYLLAAHALRDQPSTDDFMLIADTNDLNPTMIVRWQKYLQRTAKVHDPVFAPWHALASLPEKEFAGRAEAALKKMDRVNPLLARALLKQPPRSLPELAQRYASVLLPIEQQWGQKPAGTPEEEELRLVFHAPDAPANVEMLPYGDLSLLPDRASQAKLQELPKALEKWRAGGPAAPPRAHALEELPRPFAPYIFLRGNPSTRGEAVPRQVPPLLASGTAVPIGSGSGRLELARAIASKDNPLTARVLVNRLWQHHFGAGLVRTASDFGLRSEPPSHPDLLDYLGICAIENGWSIKKMHRMIVLSRAYVQTSNNRAEAVRIDPENRLLWKSPRRRLDFEAMRDALLVVSGKLDRKVGGPSVQNPLAGSANRRTLYSHLDRLNVPGLFRTFDFPSPDATSSGRDQTTIAPQALFLMNHPFVMECARQTLRRPDVAEKEETSKIDRLYRVLFGRPASAEEVQIGRGFVQASAGSTGWERYVHALLQTNEFCWLD
jgi:hypothetical protein